MESGTDQRTAPLTELIFKCQAFLTCKLGMVSCCKSAVKHCETNFHNPEIEYHIKRAFLDLWFFGRREAAQDAVMALPKKKADAAIVKHSNLSFRPCMPTLSW